MHPSWRPYAITIAALVVAGLVAGAEAYYWHRHNPSQVVKVTVSASPVATGSPKLHR